MRPAGAAAGMLVSVSHRPVMIADISVTVILFPDFQVFEDPSQTRARRALGQRRMGFACRPASGATGPADLPQHLRNGWRLLRSERDRRCRGAQAHQMADSEHQISAVHSVEMQFLDAIVDKIDHLLGADGGRH
jgi:hypothetical protein